MYLLCLPGIYWCIKRSLSLQHFECDLFSFVKLNITILIVSQIFNQEESYPSN